MAASFDEPPIYDSLIEVKDQKGKPTGLVGWLTEAWRPWVISIKEFLDLYITRFGINLPQITQEERDALVNVQDGFCCFITTSSGVDVKLPQIYIDGVWYVFDLTVAP